MAHSSFRPSFRPSFLATLTILTGFLMACSHTPLSAAPSAPSDFASQKNDPYSWLEEIESEKALSWVRAHNEKTLTELTAQPKYRELEPEIRKIVLAKDRIPSPSLMGGWIYNFWQDAQHVRGIWRRTRPDDYRKDEISWETLLDIDELGKNENESWVFHGGDCLPPTFDRCLLSLSRGGKDASVVREFDLPSRSFVRDGFTLPEAKSHVAWLDRDRLLVGTDFGPGSLTLSGYPRIMKIWKRGTPLKDAKVAFEAKETDVFATAYTSFRPDGKTTIFTRSPSFFEEENFLLKPDLSLEKIPFPADSHFQGDFQGFLLTKLRSEWKIGGRSFPEGALISLPTDQVGTARYETALETVFAPNSRSTIEHASHSKSRLYLTVLENVKGRILQFRHEGTAGWKHEKMAFPDHGTVGIVAANAFDDRVYASFESFLIPSSVFEIDSHDQSSAPVAVKRLPTRFQAEDLIAEQFESKSADGTMIPYFLIHKKSVKLNGQNPTLLYGYGGFEVSLTPYYLNATGKVWLESGGVYAVANIRGGGEFGPRWHQAALLTHRQRAYDDFIAVAQDLIQRKITTPRHLGIQGGSNGGLLVGAVFVQRPELFNAVLCEVPLLDMARYHKLLAGNSWMAEYGNPENPADWDSIRKYSPYQNVQAGRKYPRVFFLTSTKDDRVHPAHARKMVAKMDDQSHELLYFENIEGGHGMAADLEQRVQRTTLEYTYLFKQLF